MKDRYIPTFIINLRMRQDRRRHIMTEFKDRPEFDLHLVEPVPHPDPAQSLWLTIQDIIRTATSRAADFILLCEDDHRFTPHYTAELLEQCITDARARSCDMLSGGVSCVKSTFPVQPRLYWMEDFTGLQFTLIFPQLYPLILDFNFRPGDCADIVISALALRKLLICPFISSQKEFGYSDVTPMNNTNGHVSELFQKSEERTRDLLHVAGFYRAFKIPPVTAKETEGIDLPTYFSGNAINNNDAQNPQDGALDKFPEFAMAVMDYASQSTGTARIKTIIRKAMAADDDLVVITGDGFELTSAYRSHTFIKNIIEAHYQGAGLLLGGVTGFDSAIALSTGRFWLSSFRTADLIVIFRKLFGAILNEPFDNPDSENHSLSALTSHKMVVYPFITAPINKGSANHALTMHAERRLELIANAHRDFCQTHPIFSGSNL